MFAVDYCLFIFANPGELVLLNLAKQANGAANAAYEY